MATPGPFSVVYVYVYVMRLRARVDRIEAHLGNVALQSDVQKELKALERSLKGFASVQRRGDMRRGDEDAGDDVDEAPAAGSPPAWPAQGAWPWRN